MENEEEYTGSFEKIQKRLQDGEVAIYSKPNILLLDFDDMESYEVFEKRYCEFASIIGATDRLSLPSPSGRGRHVYIKLDKSCSISERFAIQAALGSDPKREILGLSEYLDGSKTTIDDDYRTNPIFLFEKDIRPLPDWVLSEERRKKIQYDAKLKQLQDLAAELGLFVSLPPLKVPGAVDTARSVC